MVHVQSATLKSMLLQVTPRVFFYGQLNYPALLNQRSDLNSAKNTILVSTFNGKVDNPVDNSPKMATFGRLLNMVVS